MRPSILPRRKSTKTNVKYKLYIARASTLLQSVEMTRDTKTKQNFLNKSNPI